MIGALIERRANLFQTVELQDEIAALKTQIARHQGGAHPGPVGGQARQARTETRAGQ